MQHDLKIDTRHFEDVLSGDKTFEIRKNDRDYALGDVLILRETRYACGAVAAGESLEYTGRSCTVTVHHVMRGPVYGLADGWVVMGIRKSSSPSTSEQGQMGHGWLVSVSRWGDRVLTLSEQQQFGQVSSPEDKALVRGCAQHLLSRVGL
jgi:hypothetical protein